jgi:nucleoside-diphosphate-sugar epimerase
VFNVKAERRRVGELVAELPGLFPDLAIEVTTAGGGGPLLANDRLRGELGFEPRFTLESGLDANLADVRRREAASA